MSYTNLRENERNEESQLWESFRQFTFLLMTAMLLLVLAACSDSESGSETTEATTEHSEVILKTLLAPAEVQDVKLVLNWFAKAQHGGVYAAQENGLF